MEEEIEKIEDNLILDIQKFENFKKESLEKKEFLTYQFHQNKSLSHKNRVTIEEQEDAIIKMKNLLFKGKQKIENLHFSGEENRQKIGSLIDSMEAEYSKVTKSHKMYIEILQKRLESEKNRFKNLENFTKEKKSEIKKLIEEEESKLGYSMQGQDDQKSKA